MNGYSSEDYILPHSYYPKKKKSKKEKKIEMCPPSVSLYPSIRRINGIAEYDRYNEDWHLT